jgi:hypothetical protein
MISTRALLEQFYTQEIMSTIRVEKFVGLDRHIKIRVGRLRRYVSLRSFDS